MDSSYSIFYHDVTILCQFELFQNSCHFFVHDDEYFEYLLGDLGYLGKKMIIMRKLGKWEVGSNSCDDVIKAHNNMHVRYRV